MVFKALKYSEEECGKKISHTKRKYIWVFEVDNQRYSLELVCSFMSGKRLVLLNSVPIHQSKNLNSFKMDFEFKYQIGYHNFRITQNSSAFPLFVDNTDFIVISRQQKQQRRELRLKEQAEKNILQKPIVGVNIGKSSAFPEFQDIFQANNEKSVSNIKDTDFQKFDSDFKQKQNQIIQIELSEIQPGVQQIKRQSFNVQNNIANKYSKAVTNQAEYYKATQPHHTMKQHKKTKAMYIPSPAQIFQQKKQQIKKFMKL